MIVGLRTEVYTEKTIEGSDWMYNKSISLYSHSEINAEIYLNTSYNVLILDFSESGTNILYNQTIMWQGEGREPTNLFMRVERASILQFRVEISEPETVSSVWAYVSIEIRLPLQTILDQLKSQIALSIAGVIVAIIWDRFGGKLTEDYMIFSQIPQMDIAEVTSIGFLTIMGYKFTPIATPQINLSILVIENLRSTILFPIVLWSVVAFMSMSYLTLRLSEIQYLWTIPNGREKILSRRIPVLFLRLALIAFGTVVPYTYLNYIVFGEFKFSTSLIIVSIQFSLVLIVNSLLIALLYFMIKKIIVTWTIAISILSILYMLKIPFQTLYSVNTGLTLWFQPIFIIALTVLVIRMYLVQEATR